MQFVSGSVRTGLKIIALAGTVSLLGALAAAAADASAHLDGRQLGPAAVLPFVGLLLSIAICPLASPKLWHHHYGKIAAFWALAFIVPYSNVLGTAPVATELAHTILLEYLPFLLLILALFTVSGGILLKGDLHGSAAVNTALLAIGTGVASIAGTTGASMLLIRPVIRANDNRRHNRHVIIFFIFLVANIGGALTPLGDPPLFLGFLKGVDFFWPTGHLLGPTALVAILLLGLFFALDSYLFHIDETAPPPPDPTPDSRLHIEGWPNIVLLGAILVAVLTSGIWRPGIGIPLLGVTIELQNLVRDVALLLITALSWWTTRAELRDANGFSWGPIIEVAKLFAGIFVTIIPVIAVLKAGREGALAPVIALVSDSAGHPNNAAYFWLAGGLSSFLDNAPTYLVFFNTAGGDARQLMGPLADTLTAISAGAVFMGANSYIGNAPNFMVKAIAEERGVKMPSFFGYMLWSGGLLIPCFGLVTWVFFR